MDKSMTGDGAVVREWVWNDYQMNPQAVQHISAGGKQLWGPAAVSEHNALVAHALAQAAEIERLTRDLTRAEEELATVGVEGQASEARTADLLKALERYGDHQAPCPRRYESTNRDEVCTCELDQAIAAAKETV